MMDNCKIINDLLPSYCDGLTGPESTRLIEAHINACPACAARLVTMRARQENEELERRREDFRRALPIYERNFKIKVLWIALACAVAVMIFFVLQAFSMDLALLCSGVSREHAEVVSAAVPQYRGDPEDTAYGRLIWSRTKEGKPVLAYLQQNFLGYWYVSSLVVPDAENGYDPDCFLWTEHRWNSYGGDHDPYTVAHVVFVGDNALKHIEFPQDELPAQSVARVYQNHNQYMIYITAVLESGTHYAWNVREILETYGFIAPGVQEE